MRGRFFPFRSKETGLPKPWIVQVALIFALLGIGTIGTVSYLSIQRFARAAEWSRHTDEVISTLRSLISNVEDLEHSERWFVITGDPADLGDQGDFRRGYTANLASLRKLTADNAAQGIRLERVAQLIGQLVARRDLEVDLRRQHGLTLAHAITSTEGDRTVSLQFRAAVQAMIAVEAGLSRERQAYASLWGRIALGFNFTATTVALGLVALALAFLASDLARRRDRTVHAAQAGRLARIGSWTIELPKRKLIWSDEVYDLHGLPIGTELTIERALRYYAPEMRELLSKELDACIRTGNSFDLELQIINHTGRRIWVRAIGEAELNPFGGIRRVHGTFQDVSARHHDIEALRQSEARFRELAENIEEVFWIEESENSRKTYLSPAYEKIWGRTCQSAYDQPSSWLDAVRVHDVQRVRIAMSTKQASGSYDEEYRIIRPNGEERWIRDRGFPVRDDTGEINRWVGVAEDNTDRRLLEEQVQQTQKMEAIGTLAGGIAHDFNNILASINGYTELSQLKLQDHAEIHEYLKAVLQASSRAADLVRQILTFSRQEKVERRPIQLGPVILETLKLLRAALPATIEFTTILSDDAPTVLADATQIHQIVMNLGTNAGHAARDRPGKLELKLERWTVDLAHADTKRRLRPGVYARVSVSDTGCGMNRATLARIFEPFFTTKGPGEGTGLGLSVVHGIMETHDGAITVHSQPGEGTVFRLYFPAYAGESIQEAVDGPAPRGHGQRILFVDDEDSIVKMAEQTLAVLGYAVEGTTEPAKALALFRSDPNRFALVLTDQTMPGMTGLHLASQIRQSAADVPIILMTGYSLSLTAERIGAAGICQLLLKPTSMHAMAVAVATALQTQAGLLTMARILLIDDDESYRKVLSLTLAHLGHAVTEAQNGRLGLESFARLGADLVITDIVMPEVEGIGVLMSLRKATPPVRIIAISGGGRGTAESYLNMAKLMGAARVLAKPFTVKELIAVIDEVLAGRSAEAADPA